MIDPVPIMLVYSNRWSKALAEVIGLGGSTWATPSGFRAGSQFLRRAGACLTERKTRLWVISALD